MLQRTEYDVDPNSAPSSDVLVVQPAGVPHALVYIPPIKGSSPTVEVYAEPHDARERAARLCEMEGLPPYQMSDDQSDGWLRGLIPREGAR